MTARMFKITTNQTNRMIRREVQREATKVFEILSRAEHMFYEQLFEDNGIYHNELYTHYLRNYSMLCDYVNAVIKPVHLEINEKYFTELLKP